MKQTSKIPKPLAPRDELLRDGQHLLRAELGGNQVLLCYDAERQSAATYHVEQRVWRIQVPITLPEYLQGLVVNGYDFPGGEDFKTWLAAVSGSRRGAAN